MRIGLQVAASSDPHDVVPRIEQAEADGFSTVWTAGRFDALTQLALAASRTEQIELGTAVVVTYQRHPTALAQQALTVQAACAGRHVLGLGVGHRFSVEGMQGFPWRPIRHMREYLGCLVPLLAGEAVTFGGDEFSLTGYRSPLGGAVEAPPVLIAALGPQMLRLAGQAADGTIIFLAGPRYLREVAVPTIVEAAASAGRPAPRIVAGVPVCATKRDPAIVRDAIAPSLAGYELRPSYRRILDLDRSPRTADVAMVGSADAVREALAAYAALGVTDFLASTAGEPDEQQKTYEFLAEVARFGN